MLGHGPSGIAANRSRASRWLRVNTDSARTSVTSLSGVDLPKGADALKAETSLKAATAQKMRAAVPPAKAAGTRGQVAIASKVARRCENFS